MADLADLPEMPEPNAFATLEAMCQEMKMVLAQNAELRFRLKLAKKENEELLDNMARRAYRHVEKQFEPEKDVDGRRTPWVTTTN